jgi:AcrR family transcriptional regulator
MQQQTDQKTTASRRARAHQLKRQRIAEAAGRLFHEQGFDATTTEQIAAAADVAKGTIFLYAPTKARLLVLVFETNLETAFEQAFAELPAGLPPVEALLSIFRRVYRVYEGDLDLSRRFVQEALFLTANDPPYSAVLDAFFARLVALIAGWQAAGHLLAVADPLLVTRTTFAIYFSILVGWLGGRIPDAATRDALLAAGLTLHFRGLLVHQ